MATSFHLPGDLFDFDMPNESTDLVRPETMDAQTIDEVIVPNPKNAQPAEASESKSKLLSEPAPESENEVTTSENVEPEGQAFTATIRIFGRDLNGTYTSLAFADALKYLPGNEHLDFSSRSLDDPLSRLTNIIGFYDNQARFQILNPSEVLAALRNAPVNPSDTFWVFIVRRRLDINALKIGCEPYYQAQYGREPDDAIPFLMLCFNDSECNSGIAPADAIVFRQWCGPSSKPYSLDHVIERFGFNEKRKSKFRELKLKAGLTHKRDTVSEAELKTHGPSLEVQQKRLRRYLKAQHFTTVSFLYSRLPHIRKPADAGNNPALPASWSQVCAMVAASKKPKGDPSKHIQGGLSDGKEPTEIQAAIERYITDELGEKTQNEEALSAAITLLNSVANTGERDE